MMKILFIGLVIIIISVFLQQRDGFQDSPTAADVKAEAAFKKLDTCKRYTDCKSCAAVAVCGWCPNTGKCGAVDEFGFPFNLECHPSILALYPDRCYQ